MGLIQVRSQYGVEALLDWLLDDRPTTGRASLLKQSQATGHYQRLQGRRGKLLVPTTTQGTCLDLSHRLVPWRIRGLPWPTIILCESTKERRSLCHAVARCGSFSLSCQYEYPYWAFDLQCTSNQALHPCSPSCLNLAGQLAQDQMWYE
jgi:hypothetical protein